MLGSLILYVEQCAAQYLKVVSASSKGRGQVHNRIPQLVAEEQLLGAKLFQSQIGGTQGSHACTVICSFFVQGILDKIADTLCNA